VGIKEKTNKEKGTVCSHVDADDLLKNYPSELDNAMHCLSIYLIF